MYVYEEEYSRLLCFKTWVERVKRGPEEPQQTPPEAAPAEAQRGVRPRLREQGFEVMTYYPQAQVWA